MTHVSLSIFSSCGCVWCVLLCSVLVVVLELLIWMRLTLRGRLYLPETSSTPYRSTRRVFSSRPTHTKHHITPHTPTHTHSLLSLSSTHTTHPHPLYNTNTTHTLTLTHVLCISHHHTHTHRHTLLSLLISPLALNITHTHTLPLSSTHTPHTHQDTNTHTHTQRVSIEKCSVSWEETPVLLNL